MKETTFLAAFGSQVVFRLGPGLRIFGPIIAEVELY